MAIPSKQIGWSNESNLLWSISKQIEALTGVMANRNTTTTTTTNGIPTTTTTTTTGTPTTTTTTSSSSTTTTTTTAPTYTIGQVALGGIIAYILEPGDPGYDAGTQHGLVTSTSDQTAGIAIQWYNGTYINTGATDSAIGAGLANTNAIISSQGPTATTYAAGLARAYTGGGYTDWYLPSKDELAKLYAMHLLGLGSFANYDYWSSTQFNITNAWDQRFDLGNQTNSSTGTFYYVRAIRSF